MNRAAQLRTVRACQLTQVAEVHARAFAESALTRLGLECVRRYYEWQLVGPHEHEFIGAFEKDRLQGFAIGGVSRGALCGFLRRNRGFLVTKILVRPWLLLEAELRDRCFASFNTLGKSQLNRPIIPAKASDRSFGVLAIAVVPDAQGCGVGRVLMEELEKTALTRSFCRMHLTVDVSNYRAIRFYESQGWTKGTDSVPWNGHMTKQLERTQRRLSCIAN